MTSPLTRAKDWLVEPAAQAVDAPSDAAPERPTRWLAPAPTPLDSPSGPAWFEAADQSSASAWVAVLGDARDVPAVAAGVALALRRRRGTPAAIVAVWPHGDDSAESPALAAPAWPGARLLAGRLARRGLLARAHGRLVWLMLAAGASLPAAISAPAVVAMMAPRDSAVDAVIARCAYAVVAADPDSPLAVLAIDELEGLGIAARTVGPPPAGVARAAALAGLRALPFDDRKDGAQ